MEHPVTMVLTVLTVLRDDAEDVRPLVRQHMRNGLWFVERRSWYFWVRFTVFGPPAAIAGLQSALDGRDSEKFIQDAW